MMLALQVEENRRKKLSQDPQHSMKIAHINILELKTIEIGLRRAAKTETLHRSGYVIIQY